MTFIQELKDLLVSQKGGDYVVKINKNFDDYETCADILIFAEYNCNIYDKRWKCWKECGNCHCHYSCNTSKEFNNLIAKNGYTMEWINCCIAGLYKKRT